VASRNQLIRYGIDSKKSLGDINKALGKNGLPSLTQKELINLKNVPLASDNPLIRLGQNAVGDLGEIATGLTTVGSMGYQEAKKLKANPQKELANLKSGATKYLSKGALPIAGDVANMLLSTNNSS